MNTLLKFIFILCFCNFNLYSQNNGLEKIDTLKSFIYFNPNKNNNLFLGYNFSGIILLGKDSTRLKRENASVLRWEPYIGYNFYNNFSFGFFGAIEHFQSNYLLNNVPTVHEYGLFLRYKLPFEINDKSFINKFSLTIELIFSKSNYIKYTKIYSFGSNNNYIFLDNFSNNILRVPLKINFNFYNNFTLTYSYRFESFIGNFINFNSLIGLEYVFKCKK